MFVLVKLHAAFRVIVFVYSVVENKDVLMMSHSITMSTVLPSDHLDTQSNQTHPAAKEAEHSASVYLQDDVDGGICTAILLFFSSTDGQINLI